MKRLILAVTLAIFSTPAVAGDTSPAALIASYEKAAGAKADPAAGKVFFLSTHAGGKPDTPSCTTCHTTDPKATGALRTGKAVEPLAPTANPSRFTEVAQVEKWFTRNCNSVTGRECTDIEKANIIAWLASL